MGNENDSKYENFSNKNNPQKINKNITNNSSQYVSKNFGKDNINFQKKNSGVISTSLIDEMYGEEDRTNSILNMIEPLLSNKETIVVYLRVIYSYSWDEIQEETGIPNSTARRLYANAKAKLRKELSWTLMKETS